MGGIPPLGYDPHPDPNVRELVVNASEAQTVQALFDLYDRHGSLANVEPEAESLGLRSKHHLFKSGREQGGVHLSRWQIHKILLNPVYLGKIRHKEKVWSGRHAAILDEGLWAQVHLKLQQAARRNRGRTTVATEQAVLTGKLFDETGNRLTPTHSNKSGKRHRYYVSNRLITGGPDPTGWRLPAQKLEALVANLIANHLTAATTERRLLAIPDLRCGEGLLRASRNIVQKLRRKDPDTLRALLISGCQSQSKKGPNRGVEWGH